MNVLFNLLSDKVNVNMAFKYMYSIEHVDLTEFLLCYKCERVNYIERATVNQPRVTSRSLPSTWAANNILRSYWQVSSDVRRRYLIFVSRNKPLTPASLQWH